MTAYQGPFDQVMNGLCSGLFNPLTLKVVVTHLMMPQVFLLALSSAALMESLNPKSVHSLILPFQCFFLFFCCCFFCFLFVCFFFVVFFFVFFCLPLFLALIPALSLTCQRIFRRRHTMWVSAPSLWPDSRSSCISTAFRSYCKPRHMNGDNY